MVQKHNNIFKNKNCNFEKMRVRIGGGFAKASVDRKIQKLIASRGVWASNLFIIYKTVI